MSLLFAESALYSRHPGLHTGCGDKGLTIEECKEALDFFRYGVTHVQRINLVDRPEGCFVEQRSRKAFFNVIKGTPSASHQDISICFAGS